MNLSHVVHNAERSRFEQLAEGHLCVADYQLHSGVMRLMHTEVHPSLQGRGIAAALVEAALRYARERRLKVDPVCGYVATYMQRHPQTLDLLV